VRLHEDGLSFREQLELYRGAALVVGVMGAGLMNMLFLPRKAHVLCVAWPQMWPCQELYTPVASHLDLVLHEFLQLLEPTAFSLN